MSNINTTFAFFNTVDYTGTPSTSSYALPFTPLTFIPKLDTTENFLSRKRIVWDFGDNTTSETVTATHTYQDAGKYKVTCYLYDATGESYYDSYSVNVTIKNYIEDFILITANNATQLQLSAGRFTDPVKITNGISWQALNNDPENNLSIVAFISGSNSLDYFRDNLVNTRYGHLYPSSSVYLLLTGINNLTEFVEVSSFNTISTPIYIGLSGNNIVRKSSTDTDAFFCGLTGERFVFYKDDLPSSHVNIMFGYQPAELRPYSNTSTVGCKASIYNNNDYNYLSISSNGIDGEGTTSNTFNISKNKFSNTKIGFVVKVKDSENFTIKNLPRLVDIDFQLTNGVTNFSSITLPQSLLTESLSTIYVENNIDMLELEEAVGSYQAYFFADFQSLTSISQGGFYKGYLITNFNTLQENVYISARSILPEELFRINSESDENILAEDTSALVIEDYIVQLLGNSNTFNVYPSGGVYNIAKKGEQIDFQDAFKSIAFQPLFLDKINLFDQFLGTIFGNISSEQTSIGKTTYEKIQNFVSNNATLDYGNVNQLGSLLKLMNQDDIQFTSFNMNYPVGLGRLINLLSISHSKLFGVKNAFSENFNTYGYLSSDIYGKNLGNGVSIQYTVTAGTDLVAFEKFSGNYKYLNTYLPLCSYGISLSGNTYKLSDYNNSWGWGLVLPSDNLGEDISNYYLFYEYTPGINGTITGSVIDFNDFNTTLQYTNSSYADWSKKEGIISNIVTKELYDGLNLFL
jgi:hypothetical protein